MLLLIGGCACQQYLRVTMQHQFAHQQSVHMLYHSRCQCPSTPSVPIVVRNNLAILFAFNAHFWRAMPTGTVAKEAITQMGSIQFWSGQMAGFHSPLLTWLKFCENVEKWNQQARYHKLAEAINGNYESLAQHGRKKWAAMTSHHWVKNCESR